MTIFTNINNSRENITKKKKNDYNTKQINYIYFIHFFAIFFMFFFIYIYNNENYHAKNLHAHICFSNGCKNISTIF